MIFFNFFTVDPLYLGLYLLPYWKSAMPRPFWILFFVPSYFLYLAFAPLAPAEVLFVSLWSAGIFTYPRDLNWKKYISNGVGYLFIIGF